MYIVIYRGRESEEGWVVLMDAYDTLPAARDSVRSQVAEDTRLGLDIEYLILNTFVVEQAKITRPAPTVPTVEFIPVQKEEV